MATKLYIAGKITGDPDYKAKFEAAAEEYKKNGYIVLCPSWMPQGMQPADYMRICFAMIDTADVVAFLPGFSKSPGARLEAEYCFYTDKNTIMPEGESLETPIDEEMQAAKEFIDKIKALNNCNTCRNISMCLFAPSVGETVRFNCPFWAKALPPKKRLRSDILKGCAPNCRHSVTPMEDGKK